jgi:hypothetical protein
VRTAEQMRALGRVATLMAQHAEQMQRIDVVGVFRKLRAIALFGFVEAALTVQVNRFLEHALNFSWKWERGGRCQHGDTHAAAQSQPRLASQNYDAWRRIGFTRRCRRRDGTQSVD